MLTRGRSLPLLVAAALIAAACTSAATPAPTAAPSTAPTAAPTKTTDGTLPKPELTKIKIAASVAEISQFGVLIAKQLGIYEKYGLQVDVVLLNDDASVGNAMFSGQADMSTVGSGLLVASRLTDTPAKELAVQKVKVVDGLFCGKDIKTAADLKGKAIAVSSLGSTAHASALLAVQALKLNETDVTYQPVGGQSVRIAALKAGSIACAPVAMDQAKDLTALGFNVLVDLSKSGLQYPASGVSALDGFVKKNPNTVLVVLGSLLEGLHFMLTQPDKAAALWGAYAQIDSTKAAAAVAALPDQANPTLRWTPEGFAFTQKVMAIISPGITTVDVTQSYDASFLKTLEDIGFYKKIGVALS